MRHRNSGLFLAFGVGVAALAATACVVEPASLGQRPDSSTPGDGGAGGGGEGGAAPAPQCEGPNPAPCNPKNPCAPGTVCVEAEIAATVCMPSECTCTGAGEWSCNDDCLRAASCVPTVEGAARVAYGCGSVDDAIIALHVGLSERSCSSDTSYPYLQIVPVLKEETGFGIVAGRTFEVDTAPDSIQLQTRYVRGPGDVVSISSGTIFIGSIIPASVTGTYDVALADGARLHGNFDAINCRPTAPTEPFCPLALFGGLGARELRRARRAVRAGGR